MAARKKPAAPVLPTATHTILGDLEQALIEQAKTGKPMEWHQAKAFSVVLERLRADNNIIAALALHDAPSEWGTPQKQFQIGYHLRLEQEIAPNEKQYLVAAEVARVWSCVLKESVTDNSVINYASRFRAAIEHRLSMMDGNAEYSGLTREEMLKRELADWRPLPPK